MIGASSILKKLILMYSIAIILAGLVLAGALFKLVSRSILKKRAGEEKLRAAMRQADPRMRPY
jgi:hypothetical protein